MDKINFCLVNINSIIKVKIKKKKKKKNERKKEKKNLYTLYLHPLLFNKIK